MQKIKYLTVLTAIVLCSLTSMAQREKNYIFLFDCTGSMRTNGLWETAQSALDNNILLRKSLPGSHFTVIPFGKTRYDGCASGAGELEIVALSIRLRPILNWQVQN